MNFLYRMALFKRRVRPKHEIIINIDIAIQDCQKKLNDAEKAHKKSEALATSINLGVAPERIGTSTGWYGKHQKDAFKKLRELLLKDIKDIDAEISKHTFE